MSEKPKKELRPVAYTCEQTPVIPANTKQTPLFPVWGHRNWSRSLSILNQTFGNPQFYTTVPVKHFVPFPCHNFLYHFSYLVNDCPICIFFCWLCAEALCTQKQSYSCLKILLWHCALHTLILHCIRTQFLYSYLVVNQKVDIYAHLLRTHF